MWKPEYRIAAERSSLRYPSDLTDVLNGIFYVLWTDCQWQALPKDLPPKSAVWDYFHLWTWDGLIHSRRV
jgi:transposase